VPFTGSTVAISLYNSTVALPPATGTSTAVVVGPAAAPDGAAVVADGDALSPSSPQAATTMLTVSSSTNQRDRRAHLISRTCLIRSPPLNTICPSGPSRP
jgi:hypothetical protein